MLYRAVVGLGFLYPIFPTLSVTIQNRNNDGEQWIHLAERLECYTDDVVMCVLVEFRVARDWIELERLE